MIANGCRRLFCGGGWLVGPHEGCDGVDGRGAVPCEGLSIPRCVERLIVAAIVANVAHAREAIFLACEGGEPAETFHARREAILAEISSLASLAAAAVLAVCVEV